MGPRRWNLAEVSGNVIVMVEKRGDETNKNPKKKNSDIFIFGK